MADLMALPHLQALSLWGDVPMTQVLDTIVEEYVTNQTISNCLKDKKAIPKVMKDAMVYIDQDADRLIAKQYRKASLKVHPDRFGNTYQVEFAKLQSAYETLREAITRREYVQKLLNVVHLVGPNSHLVQTANDSWVQDHDVATSQDTTHARYTKSSARKQQEKQGAQHTHPGTVFEQYRLEGDIWNRIPGWLHIQKEQGKTLQIGLQINNFPEVRELLPIRRENRTMRKPSSHWPVSSLTTL